MASLYPIYVRDGMAFTEFSPVYHSQGFTGGFYRLSGSTEIGITQFGVSSFTGQQLAVVAISD
jgi:hypothetical protein